MTEDLIALVPLYGSWLIAVVTFLSCLAVPVPASLVMITAGGFVASGDLGPLQTLGAAAGGAILGDQTGYAIGRKGGRHLLARIGQSPARARVIDQATGLLRARGWLGVFLSRWLFSPLGPWLNLASGAAPLDWRVFTQAGIAGELLWVTIYVGLGWSFSAHILLLADLLGSASGFLAALAVAIGLGFWLRRALRSNNSPPRGR